ncbi:MAG TPA: MFS transporter, partial [bacterium]|nr:MFS transporter [bacterium]
MKQASKKTKQLHDPYAALRLVDFRSYLITNFLVTFGSQMVGTALGWELYEKTGSALDLGLLGLFFALPFIFLAPLGGNVADRFDRRVTIVLSTLVYSLALIGLAFGSYFNERIGHYNYWVFGIALAAASSNAFYIPAKQAFFNQLVPRSVLPNAVTWSSSTWQAASVLGPAAAGWLITRIPYPAG